MKLSILAVGRLRNEPEALIIKRYEERLKGAGRALGLHPVEVRELPESKAASAPERKREEALRLLHAAGPDAYIVTLDEAGSSLGSVAFAGLIRQRRDGGTGVMAFLIGGPDGHGAEARTAAGLVLSLGSMTLPHGLARAVLIEQIYRTVTILSGHPYHRA